MKKTILPAIAWATAGFLFSPFSLFAQTDITLQDDAKVGVIVTGTGNVINTTQIIGKSPEYDYDELKKRLDYLENRIKAKAKKCGKYTDPVAQDDCRAELIALKAERDSMQKIETHFRENVIRLAEAFSKNELNNTPIFGKSPEYAELKKRLDYLDAAISKKAGECVQILTDNLPQKYLAACRTEMIALNTERDSVQKIETRFREDVIRLAETFSKIELSSDRLRLANQFFDEGKIREADNLLNVKEMLQEGDALLVQKERAQYASQPTDSLLHIKADEFALKARLKAIDYTDSLRYDSAVIYFEQSRRYAETVNNLREFAYLLWQDKQSHKAIPYFQRAIQLADNERDEAELAMNLGAAYADVQKMAGAEKMYLRSLEIYERLAKSNSAQFEPYLAMTLGNLSFFYLFVNKYPESQAAAEKVLALDSAQTWIYVNLGHSYLLRGDWENAKKVYEEYLKNESDPAAAKATLLQDWDDLEKAGVTHKDMAKARAWVKE